MEPNCCQACGESLYVGHVCGRPRWLADPQVTSRFEIVNCIGRGGMGEAYLAVHRKLGRKEVLKGILTKRLDAEHVRRFEEEAKAATLVQHPNVATLHDLLLCADDTPVAVWEYVEGESLRQLLERELPSVRRAMEIMLQLLDGLGAIHERMLHRDIKPENLMLRANGQLKIIDFGLAKELGAEPTTDAPIGTYHYLAPEAMRMEVSRLERTVDIFAAGAVFYEMLTGALAFQGGSVIQVAYKILNDDPLWIGRLDPNLPLAPMMIAMIKRAIAKSPADRYQTAAEFSDDLRGALRRIDKLDAPVMGNRPGMPAQASLSSNLDDSSEANALALPERAALNPALFAFLGKFQRIAFLSVSDYGGFDRDRFRGGELEIYAVTGQHDVIAIHLDRSAYSLMYSVNLFLPWVVRHGNGERMGDNGVDIQSVPYFEVTSFHKVGGTVISPQTEAAFQLHTPTWLDVDNLAEIATDWATEVVDDAFRQKAQRYYWILTVVRPQRYPIEAIITVSFDEPDTGGLIAEIVSRLIIPQIVADPSVTDVLEGVGYRTSVRFVLRVNTTTKYLPALLRRIHELASTYRIMLSTETRIILEQWSSLALKRALTLPRLPDEYQGFRDRRVIPRLNEETRAVLMNWSTERQVVVVSNLQRILSTWDRIRPWPFEREQGKIEQVLAIGVIHDDLQALGDVCMTLLAGVEDWLQAYISQLNDSEVAALGAAVDIPPGKKRTHFVFGEKLRLAAALRAENRLIPVATPLDPLLSVEVGRVRNAVFHREFGRVGPQAMLDVIQQCSEVLAWIAREAV